MPIQQSGSITPGHITLWVTDGVVNDGGALGAAQKVLGSLREADFDDAADQPILLPARITAFQLTSIIITNASGDLTTAVGGFYTEASKGGELIVSAAQVYTDLDDPTKLMEATLTSYAETTRFTRTQLPDWAIYFALTTPQGGDIDADIFLVGVDLS